MYRVREEVKKAQVDRKKLMQAEAELKAAKEKAKEYIDKQVQDVITKAEAKGAEMIQIVEATCQRHMEILHENQHYTDRRLMQLQSRWGTPSVKKPRETQHEMPSFYYSSLCFKPGSCQMNSSCFGYASFCDNKICGLKLINEFGSFQYAQGIAANQAGSLVVVDYGAKKAEVFSSDKSKFKSQFYLRSPSVVYNDGSYFNVSNDETLAQPISVAVTSKGKFCVTVDKDQVKIFSPSGRYESTFQSNGHHGQITTTPDDTIITCNDKGYINVHRSGNNSSHIINFMHGSVLGNYQIMETYKIDPCNIDQVASNGKQIVYTSAEKNKVFAIDFKTGQALWSLDTVFPLGICYECKSNTLLIAGNSKERGKHVIEQYCSTTGRLISRLATGLFNPLAMTVTHDNRLLVADVKTVKVYEIH